MRQVSIPKNIVDALNELFDAHPAVLSALLSTRVSAPDPESERIAREQAAIDAIAMDKAVADHPNDGVGMAIAMNSVNYSPPTVARGPSLGVLDVVNAILDKLHPGKRIAVIQGADGLEGFTLARDRKSSAPQSDERDS